MKIQLKIFNENNCKVTDIRTTRKRRILHFIQADKTPKAKFFIKVTYEKGFNNCGEYDSKKDLLFALQAFTEE